MSLFLNTSKLGNVFLTSLSKTLKSNSISSLEISVPIERKDLLGFGSNYPYGKRIMYPLIGTVSFNGIFDEPVTGDFSSIFNNDTAYDLTFNLKNKTNILPIHKNLSNPNSYNGTELFNILIVEDNRDVISYISALLNNHYNLIVGSSNLTAQALTTNKEWNIKVSALESKKRSKIFSVLL